MVFRRNFCENLLPVENSVRVMRPHEKIFLMSVLNGLSVCLLDFELDTPPKTAKKGGGIGQANYRIRS